MGAEMMPYFFTPRHNPTHPCTTPPVYAHSMSDMYARVLRVRRTRLQQKTNCNICLQCTLQRSEKDNVKNMDFPHLTRLVSLAKPKACPSWITWQKQLGQQLSRLEVLTSLTNLQLLHLSRLPLSTSNNTHPCLGARQTCHPPTCQGYYPKH